ncbi:EAL domain-containing protein [Photobacterium chitinilyticum]|uniref:EAL domain-containing protein n=2 Tax=Photobacterium chitinilyticum TaxID=2485123 RepID=A0A3S3T1B4_9GAMM|nr:EAL domain-containing protein [Photobacterium chitinilyticum]
MIVRVFMINERLKNNGCYEMCDDNTEGFIDVKFSLQPIVCPKTMNFIAFEMLTRFEDAKINVEDFFNEISDGWIKAIIRLQVNEINRIKFDDLSYTSINFNTKIMADDKFISCILNQVNKKIAFEITTSPSSNIEEMKLINSIVNIKSRGHEVWLDDYLSEEISESMLFIADWDLVKIDKSIMYKYLGDYEYMLDLIADASDFGRRNIVFEGVETNYQHEQLSKYKCLHQGYYYGSLIECASIERIGHRFSFEYQ